MRLDTALVQIWLSQRIEMSLKNRTESVVDWAGNAVGPLLCPRGRRRTEHSKRKNDQHNKTSPHNNYSLRNVTPMSTSTEFSLEASKPVGALTVDVLQLGYRTS